MVTQHLVRKGDLNHHESLYAGRSAEWIIETGFITAASFLPKNSIVAVKLNELCYHTPVYAGEVVKMEGSAVHAGNTSLMVYVSAFVQERKVIDGFLTFVHVDEYGKSKPHGIKIIAATEEEFLLQEKARKYFSQEDQAYL